MPSDLNRLADRFGQLRVVLAAPAARRTAVPKVLAFQLGGLLEGAGLNPLVPVTTLNLLDPNLGADQARNPSMMLFFRYFLAVTLLQAKRAPLAEVREVLVQLSERLEGLARSWSSGRTDAEELAELVEENRGLAKQIRGFGDGQAA
ncbi:hypothetical protein [Nocardia gipuzkoensis]|uniref:hypothetical protein n=1 Tax=Nocardia gipuzkoensis TaxID=2749991 RepID=UPI0015EF524F|nr:hypothetical protein [Nocardia gipuzkoensis]